MVKDRKTIQDARRRLSKSDIIVKSNTSARLNLEGNKNKYSIQPYDTETIPFEDLQAIARKQKNVFFSFLCVIEDAYNDSGDFIEIEEVYMALGLGKIVEDLDNMPDEYYFDDLLKKDSFETFKTEIRDMDEKIICRLAERAVYLHDKKEFGDSYKMSIIEKILNRNYVFEDIDRSNREIKDDIDII